MAKNPFQAQSMLSIVTCASIAAFTYASAAHATYSPSTEKALIWSPSSTYLDVEPANNQKAAVPQLPLKEGEVQLLFVSSDNATTTAFFRGIVNNDGDMTGLRFYKMKSQNTAEESYYSLEELRNGATLMKSPTGSEVVSLKAPGFDAKAGGAVTLKVLRVLGFMENDYRKLPIELKKENGSWIMYTNTQAGRNAFDSVKVVGRYLGPIPKGVKTLIMYLGDQLSGTFETDDLEVIE